jgi:DNA polymerase III epsilon subunit-like protein
MVKYINGEIVDRFYTLIHPPFDYPGKCGSVLTWIHGLTEDMVKDARTFEELLPEIESFVDGLPLVAHNACVERACIRNASAFYGVETKLDYENIYDTLMLSRQAEAKLGISEEGLGTHQLDTVCKRFGISGNNHHNALADAEMSGNLMVLFQRILCEGDTVEIKASSPTPNYKYNPEDKIQRTDLDNIADNPFKNQVVVLTGFAKADSQEYAHKLNELGAIIKDGVNKKTSILITGYNAGPAKLQKAKEFGVRILPEEEFIDIIKSL